ncbi:tryptophan 7-halogenase [Synechococcus sp. PCC 7336]|uniref:tryptophan 7-halogenase n=1 Tax=Synechococcus sp. PCC 7336 TaxID=195250 RepID=UPI000349D9F2|nr:tryptophan 7-halogenase [Synechococcus sp. PCC 7336]
MNVEVAIIGGGPAGAAAAQILASAGCKTLLVDAASPKRFKIGESLLPAAQRLLEDLGAGDRFLADKHLPCYGYASAWGSAEIYSTDFIRSPHGYGWHLDRARFDASLREAAADAGAVCQFQMALSQCNRVNGSWKLRLTGSGTGDTITAEWVFDCTGRSRKVARSLGVEAQDGDRLRAFYAQFQPMQGRPDRDALSSIESVPEGWWYTAKLPGDRRIVAFFTDADSDCASAARTEAGFLQLCDRTIHLKQKLAEFEYAIATKPQGTEAGSSRLQCFHGEGWMAVGDAAMSFDPLSSQGIYTAMYGGVKAARAWLAWQGGDRAALDHYDAALSEVYRQYLRHRLHYYQMEQRWQASAFWARKMAATGSVANTVL